MWLPDWLTGYDAANAAAAARADATLAALNQAQADAGTITQDELARRAGYLGVSAADQRQQIADEFQQGISDAAGRMADRVDASLNGIGATVWRAVPVWVWLMAALGLFLYLGGGEFIRRKLEKA